MGYKTVASNRSARVWAAEDHQKYDGVALQKLSVDASTRADEASRDLAYQFLRMNRAARRATIADNNHSAAPSNYISSKDHISMAADSTQAQGRRHSSFQPETMSSLAYRIKEPSHNPRKHQRGSPSVDSVEERLGFTEERHCKRISGDSGYGSDTRRRRCEQSRAVSDRHDPSIEVPSKSKAVVISCSASDSESDETSGVSKRPKRDLRRHSVAVGTKTSSTPTSVTLSNRQNSSVESLSQSSKGLRRVKGTTTLRSEVSPQLQPSRPKIEIATTITPNISAVSEHCARRPNLLTKISTWSPNSQETTRPMTQRHPRPVSGPPTLPLNWHANVVPKLTFSPVEEQSDLANDSGDESSLESSVFSIPDSPIEPCQLERDDPFVPHLDAAITNVLQRYRDWQVRQRGGQGGRGPAGLVSSDTPDSGRSSRKRSHSDQPDQPDADGDPNLLPGSKRPRVPAPRPKMLACPFWKKDPDNHRHCYKRVLSKIKYVKSHLYRFHAAPITCPCCGAVFQNEEARDQHLRARRCEVVEPGYTADHEGLTPGRMRQVSRRADPKHTEEEQWFVIWGIIFPGTPPPSSPYIDGALSEDLCRFREFFTSSGNEVILDYFSVYDPEFARSERISLYERFVRDGVLERIFEQWYTNRRLRPPEEANIFTPPQSHPTDSENASRASSAHRHSFVQWSTQAYPVEGIQPVPASDLQFAGQAFEELDFGGGLHYDSHTQGLLDDLEEMFPDAEQQYSQGSAGPSYTR